jgi:cytochrome c553
MNALSRFKPLVFLGILAFGATAPAVFAAGSVGNAEAGKLLAQPCQACHGADGNSTAAIYPRLAGQYADYLARSMQEYRDGGRVNPIMSVYVEKLSDKDIENLAAYFSAMPGKLDDLHAHMKAE